MTDSEESSVIDGSCNDSPEATSTYTANVFAASMRVPLKFRPLRFVHRHQRLLFWSVLAQLQYGLPTKVVVLMSCFWAILQLPVNCCWSFNQGDRVIEAILEGRAVGSGGGIHSEPGTGLLLSLLLKAEKATWGATIKEHCRGWTWADRCLHQAALSLSLSLWQQLLYPRRDSWGSWETETYRQGHRQSIWAPLTDLVLFISTYPSLRPVKFAWPAWELQLCWTWGHGKRLYWSV